MDDSTQACLGSLILHDPFLRPLIVHVLPLRSIRIWNCITTTTRHVWSFLSCQTVAFWMVVHWMPVFSKGSHLRPVCAVKREYTGRWGSLCTLFGAAGWTGTSLSLWQKTTSREDVLSHLILQGSCIRLKWEMPMPLSVQFSIHSECFPKSSREKQALSRLLFRSDIKVMSSEMQQDTRMLVQVHLTFSPWHIFGTWNWEHCYWMLLDVLVQIKHGFNMCSCISNLCWVLMAVRPGQVNKQLPVLTAEAPCGWISWRVEMLNNQFRFAHWSFLDWSWGLVVAA